ncbi:MAG: exonuclease domain-containing protein [Clostridia bacterium]|nr:exonuclease domain-containing protein [Clostridia bacterium]
MHYVIMDLEWNNSYNKYKKCFVNEILEIGAVIADEELEVLDTFSVIIKSQLIKKLSGRVKNLTHITNEDMYSGVSFQKAISDFSKWIGGRNCVFLSWGNSDIRVLYDNFSMFCGINGIPFLTQYVDLQKYCQEFIVNARNQQIGLVNAATEMGIDVSQCKFHRALEDSLLGLRCLKKCFNREHLLNSAVMCDKAFYQKLLFKSTVITNIHSKKIDRTKMKCDCSVCGAPMKRLSDWKSVNQAFSALFYCKNCERLVNFSIRFKEYYDRIDVKTNVTEMKMETEAEEPERAGEITAASPAESPAQGPQGS